MSEKFFHLRFESVRMHLVDLKLQSELLTVTGYIIINNNNNNSNNNNNNNNNNN